MFQKTYTLCHHAPFKDLPAVKVLISIYKFQETYVVTLLISQYSHQYINFNLILKQIYLYFEQYTLEEELLNHNILIRNLLIEQFQSENPEFTSIK